MKRNGALLAGEIDQQPREERVLEYVGEIAGVEAVAIVHYGGPGDVVVCARRVSASTVTLSPEFGIGSNEVVDLEQPPARS